MSDDYVNLTRRKVLGGLAGIGAAGAAAGAGTMALFSDTENSSGNTVSAGTLDLTLSQDTSGATSMSFSDVKPGDQGYVVIKLTNGGSIDGSVDVNVGSVDSSGNFTASLVTDSEGSNPDAETNTDTSDGGELADQLEVGAYIQSSSLSSGQNTGDYAETNANDTVFSADTVSSVVGTYDTNYSLSSGSSTYLVVAWKFPDQSDNNAAQGDKVAFDVQVVLNQQDSQ